MGDRRGRGIPGGTPRQIGGGSRGHVTPVPRRNATPAPCPAFWDNAAPPQEAVSRSRIDECLPPLPQLPSALRSAILRAFDPPERGFTSNAEAADRQEIHGCDTCQRGPGGYTITDLGGNEQPDAIAIQDNGAILVSGHSDLYGDSDCLLMRYTPDGNLDATFGFGGVSLVDLGGDESCASIGLQSDGKIVLGGTQVASDENFAVLRFLEDGTISLQALGNLVNGTYTLQGNKLNIELIPTGAFWGEQDDLDLRLFGFLTHVKSFSLKNGNLILDLAKNDGQIIFGEP